MFDYTALKSQIKSKYTNINDFCKDLGISKATLYSRYAKGDFTADEMIKASELLKFGRNKIQLYFFTYKV